MEFDFESNRKTSYIYDGSVCKLTMIYSPGTYWPTNIECRGQFVHQSCNGTSSLKYIITPEGMLKNKDTNAVPIWEWNYNLTDHLGNVRTVFRPTATNGVEKLSHTNYLPFGLKMQYPYSSASASNYLYNGKELQGDGGLDLYDYGARFYDPALGRWHSVDPSADENGQEVASPYCYVGNNPILRIDPDGRIWDDQVNDQKIADRIQNGIKDRLSAENSNLESANKTVAKLEAKIAEKGSSRGLESRLSNAKDGIASIGATISYLNSSSQ